MLLTTQPENPIHFRELCTRDGPVREIRNQNGNLGKMLSLPAETAVAVARAVVRTRSSEGFHYVRRNSGHASDQVVKDARL